MGQKTHPAQRTQKIVHFRGDVSDSPRALDLASRDTSLFEVRPALVVYPKDAADLKILVKHAAAERRAGAGVSLTARSGGSDMTGGPLTESIVVDFTRYFNHLKKIGRGFAVVEPGVFYRDFERATLKANLLLPCYPASREMCTLGGMIANNAGGEKTLRYGKTEQYVEALKVVLADGNEYTFRALSEHELAAKQRQENFEGEVYRKMHALILDNWPAITAAKPKVSKNSAGYCLWNVWDFTARKFDLTKLFTGAQGTLGFITEARLKLVRPHRHSRMLVVFLRELAPLPKIINHILDFQPDSFESYDDHTFHVAVKLFPEIARRLRGGLLTMAVRFLPEFWAALSGGIPKMVLLVEFTGDKEQEVLARAREARDSLREFRHLKTRLTLSSEEGEKYWVIRRESFNLLRHHIKKLHTAPFIDDLIVRPEQLPRFLPRLYEILDGYNIVYTVAGHVGDANFHIIPLMDFRARDFRKTIVEITERVYDLVFAFGGSMTAEHNDGLIRSPYLEKMYGPEIYKLFVETKKIFDPLGIFNPGKKVGASLDFALEHIKRS
ncbi:MAG: FAD-binding oxidoreductase [Candidatus Doudnabacteria bacterium]|nr:FAD-binding oxidoreductase [Candidatus Doudnabacteria bacterium]